MTRLSTYRNTRRVVSAAIVAVVTVALLPVLWISAPTPVFAASCAANADAPVVVEPSPGQRRMGAERAWSRTTGTVTVAVIDTGVSAQTASLDGAVLPGSDLSGGRGNVDCYGRGTFIASLTAGRVMEGTEFAGVAPGATILPIRVADDPYEHSLDAVLPGLLAKAIGESVAGGAQVIAVALSTTSSSAALRSAVKAALDKDVLIVAPAARADGETAFPANLDGVLSVAPLVSGGGIDASELGAAADLASPVDGLVGAVPDGDGHVEGTDYALAVAYVAGAAALVMEEYPQMSAQEVGKRLVETADGPTSGYLADERYDASIGYGVVNPVAAVTRLVTDATAEPAPAVTALALPAKPDERPVNLALIATLGALVVAALVIGPTVGVTLARRKRAAQ